MKLIYFSSPHCGPCRTFGPIMEQVSKTCQVQKINVDEDSTLTIKYNIRNVPTVVKVDSNGNEIDKFVGVKTEQQVKDFYNN